MKKLNQGFDHWEEYELVPGLTMTVRFEGSNGLPEVVDRFLRHKASVPEMKKSLRAWGGPRRPDIASATSMGEK